MPLCCHSSMPTWRDSMFRRAMFTIPSYMPYRQTLSRDRQRILLNRHRPVSSSICNSSYSDNINRCVCSPVPPVVLLVLEAAKEQHFSRITNWFVYLVLKYYKLYPFVIKKLRRFTVDVTVGNQAFQIIRQLTNRCILI